MALNLVKSGGEIVYYSPNLKFIVLKYILKIINKKFDRIKFIIIIHEDNAKLFYFYRSFDINAEKISYFCEIISFDF